MDREPTNVDDNKTYRQVRDMLKLAQRAYRELSDYYAKRNLELKERRAAMLVDYLQGHEEKMESVLSDTMASISEKTLDTFYQYEPESVERILPEVYELHFDDDAGTDEITAKAIRFHEIMRDYYAKAEDMAGSQAVAEVFKNLKDEEVNKVQTIAQDANALHDI
jgi:hypothetical protein